MGVEMGVETDVETDVEMDAGNGVPATREVRSRPVGEAAASARAFASTNPHMAAS
jgi:hypothetical protein